MQTSTTRLEKPLYLWLARMITLGIILACIGISASRLPEILDKQKHEGIVWDIYFEVNPNGEAIIGYVSPTAEQKGVAIGDKILNYKDLPPGKIGTPVTFHIQRGSLPARDITFLPGPANQVVFGGIQLGLSFDVSVIMAILFVLIPLVIGVMGSMLLYRLRSNDWMTLLTAMVLANGGG